MQPETAGNTSPTGNTNFTDETKTQIKLWTDGQTNTQADTQTNSWLANVKLHKASMTVTAGRACLTTMTTTSSCRS